MNKESLPTSSGLEGGGEENPQEGLGTAVLELKV